MKQGIAFFVFLFLSFNAISQPLDFKFGPRFGIGKSTFVDFPATSRSGAALQAAVDATWQFKQFFATEFSPAITMYSGYLRMEEQSGYDSRGQPIMYPYKDIYNIFAVEFPVFLKFSFGSKKVRYGTFFGSGIGFTMGGTHSKKYDDADYDADHRFVGHGMKEIADSYYVGVLGASVEWKLRKGVLGFSGRIQRSNAIAAIEGSKFAVRGIMFGASWEIQ